MSEAALEALRRGEAAADAGDLPAARDWLERGLRLAPGDPAIALSLAGVRLRQDDHQGAAVLFEPVARKHDVGQAWLGLAAALHRLGRHGEAAEAVAQALSRHAHDPDEDAAADAIAQSVGAPGWCALDTRGRVLVRSLAQPSRAHALAAALDGRPLALRPSSAGIVTHEAALRPGWERAGALTVALDGAPLLGSPINIPAIARVEGFVDSRNGDLHGWAFHPSDLARDPVLSVRPAKGKGGISIVAARRDPGLRHRNPRAVLRGFRIPAADLDGFDGPLHVRGPDGRDLTGSPLDRAKLAPAATPTGPAPKPPARPRPVDIVIPVYGALDLALACIGSVQAALPGWARIVVVDDASPDPAVQRALRAISGVVLITQPSNRGFPAAANAGMRHDVTRDVVLLNSDTLVPPGWLQRLRDAAYAAPDIATVTPLSNDATLVSYPSVTAENPIPDRARTAALDALSHAANADERIDIPTAIGFCMYIRRDALAATGPFREDVFAQGYGEENDFCLRAGALGWRHVAATGVFVGHVGAQSFASAREHLLKRNLGRLNRLHPGYDRMIRAFKSADPLAPARRRMDTARWIAARDAPWSWEGRSLLLVTHDRAGGVLRSVEERATALRAQGIRPIILRPALLADGGRGIELHDPALGDTPNLRFALPAELPGLAALLAGDHPLRAEIHHLIGHDHALMGLFPRLNIPFDIAVHDYSWFCPRVNLIGPEGRYCGEPDVAGCELCIAAAGATNGESTPPATLRARSAAEFSAAAAVIVPSPDAAKRLKRHFPATEPVIRPLEDDAALPPRTAPPRAALRTVCVVGAIGIEKGFEILLACAQDAAARGLPLAFRIVGYTSDDAALLATGRAAVTGPYGEDEALALIRAQNADLAFLPSLWPETWSYTLTQAWQAGLDVAAFDIGAPADRIRATGRGWIFPLGLHPAQINDVLLRLPLQPAPDLPEGRAAFMTPERWFAWLFRDDARGGAELGDIAAQGSFLAWWREHGMREYPGARTPLPPTGRPLARPAILARAMPDGVNLIGFARAEFGLGEDIRSLSAALDAAGMPHAVLDIRPGNAARRADRSLDARFTDRLRHPVSIICASPFDTARMYLEHGPALFTAPRTIGYWPWELPLLPPAWNGVFSLVDEVWAPSRFSAQAFAASPNPVLAMPPAVLTPGVRPMSRRRAGLPPRAFVFAYPFDPNSYMARKNPIALVRAFRRAFAQADASVALLLRVNGTPDAAQPAWRDLAAAIAGDPRIIVRDGTLSRADALALLAACDALVSPHRSEGFGRNIAEAILLGLPVRATGFSGSADFLRPAESLAWTPRAVAPGEYPFGEGQSWAEPDPEHLVAALRELRAGARPDPARAAAFLATHDAAPVGARVAERIRFLLGQARN